MMLVKKMKSIALFVVAFLSTMFSYGQVVGTNAFVMGDWVNVAVSGERGREGTDVVGAGFHQRAPATRCGFVADPLMSGWAPGTGGFNGDFFMPGTPENGWGLELDGVEFSNNYDDYDIPFDPANPITHSVEGDCITVEWQGITGTGVIVNIKYHHTTGELFYTTEITLINGSGTDITEAYYYRNVDPDNNQPISFDYSTTNTIVSQPEDDCQKSLVSAEHDLPHESYVGFGALGPDFRVTHGGFSNRDGSDIWNGAGGLTATVGAVADADQAISLAYKTELLDGDTTNFTFAVVLSGDAVESAFSSLYYIDYESIGDIGGGVIDQCNPTIDTASSCAGAPVILTVDGPNADDYAWTWVSEPLDPDAPTDGPTIEVSPTETTNYTVEGIPISDCLSGSITKTIVVEFTEGPDISIEDPGPYCEDFTLADLVFSDLNDTEDPNIVFLSEEPDSADQTEPAYTDPTMGPDDEVWLLIGDPDGGCFDAVLIEIDFGGLGAAGADSSIALCGTDGTIVDLHDLIEEGANIFGDFDETTFSGQFNEATGELDVSGLAGVYTFTYTVEGVDPCPDDEATFTVEVYAQPTADFEYEVDGVSSADGLGSTCLENEVDFVNGSTIPAPGTITSYDWDFGDGTGSSDENPSHLYTSIGTYTITLTVTTDDGCESVHTKEIIIYAEPIVDVIFNEPSCHGFSDGSITAFVAGGSGTFEIEIRDEDGTVLNPEGSNTANTLTAGTYTIYVADGSGCDVEFDVVLNDPPELIAYYRIVPPLCYGDTGHVVIDSVSTEGINNAMSYFWAPETDVPNGFEADSVNIPAGDYTLTINDSKGCSNVYDITMTQPDSLYFNSDTGYDPAYCRLFGYQTGHGVVYASASGGTGTATYEWTEVSTGDTWPNSTWGGRNPGLHTIVATDENGCTVTWTVDVDSLNPIADFDVISAELNTDLQGTAPVSVEFENQSLYFANPNNPDRDTIMRWSLDSPTTDWFLTHDYFFKPDTVYGPRGESYTVTVCLQTQNVNGCTDEMCKVITIYEPITFTNVNIFSPNGDGVNDIFTFSQYAKSISEFECIIVNRWGVQVGEINDINDVGMEPIIMETKSKTEFTSTRSKQRQITLRLLRGKER